MHHRASIHLQIIAPMDSALRQQSHHHQIKLFKVQSLIRCDQDFCAIPPLKFFNTGLFLLLQQRGNSGMCSDDDALLVNLMA